MKKTGLSSFIYALFFMFGHGGNNDAIAQNSDLNSYAYPYYNTSAEAGTKYADCKLDAENQAKVQHMRDVINGY